jgi:hypothetical protein
VSLYEHGNEYSKKSYFRNPKGGDYVSDLDVFGRIILSRILRA